MANTTERVFVDADGEAHCDPWVLFDNWVTAAGLDADMDDRPLDVVRWYGQWYLGERVTGDLFAQEATT